MVKLYVTDAGGQEHVLDTQVGLSVMEAVCHQQLPMKAECEGCCCCATCHIYVDGQWVDKIPPASDEENDCLDGAFAVDETSRLACQVIVTEDLDGLQLKIAPDAQV